MGIKVDIGFWNAEGMYIPDVQEVNEMERKEIMETKNFNEFFDELNDMASFKNFGEQEETEQKEIIIDGVDVAGCKYYLFRDKQPAGERSCGVGLIDCNGQNCTYKQLKRLQQERDELKKELGTKEIQLANAEFDLHFEETKTRDLVKQIDELKAENERLNKLTGIFSARLCKKYRTTLQEIKKIIEKGQWDFAGVTEKQILQKISEVME